MKKITQEEFNKILDNHFKWLWYKKRSHISGFENLPKGERADLSNTDLRDLTITPEFHTMTEINLNGADLSNMDLSEMKLIRADLRNANLTNTDLSMANLVGADLRNATIKNTKLYFTSMFAVNLENTILDSPRFS